MSSKTRRAAGNASATSLPIPENWLPCPGKTTAASWSSGRAVGAFCLIGGWFAPMYGAGRLERGNIVEYEDAAIYARDCGQIEMVDCILTMAEVEWEHEFFFRSKVTDHWMLRVLKVWP